MIDLDKISALQKASKASFQQQKLMIKKLMLGQHVLCSHCQHPLTLNLPSVPSTKVQSVKTHSKKPQTSSICCAKGCTDIELDFVL